MMLCKMSESVFLYNPTSNINSKSELSNKNVRNENKLVWMEKGEISLFDV